MSETQAQRMVGRIVLSTRPGGLAESLSREITKMGVCAIHLATIEIQPVHDAAKAKQIFDRLADFDVLIFISRNAVKYAEVIASNLAGRCENKTLLAVGQGTYEELQDRGFTEVGFTNNNTGSEALLDMEALCRENVENTNVLIVRGEGGRELLGDSLRARGAEVQYVEVYQRVKPQIDPLIIKNIWQKQTPDVVMATSVEGLRNLVEMTDREDLSVFLDTQLLVISQRLKCKAESMGFKATIKVAMGYSNDNFVVALKEMFEALDND
jgi:uroporphyrinogen-III synthase